MERSSESYSDQEAEGDYYKHLYIEKLFELNPDDEMLARMWEIDPETMRRLMPEIGNETAEQVDAEMTRLQSHLYMAMNSLRIALGRQIKLTPRQRMREALLQLQEDD